MIIRPVAKSDVTAFQEIMKTSIRALCTEAYGAAATAAWIADDNPAFHFKMPEFAYLAEEDGEIITAGGWSLTNSVALHAAGHTANAGAVQAASHARINAVYSKPAFAGRGFGHKMMAYLEADIRQRSALRDIYLWSTKNAIPFYLSCGYTAGIDEYPEVAPGHKIQVRYMWKRLG